MVYLHFHLSSFIFKNIKNVKDFYLHVFISIYNIDKYCNIIYNNIVNTYQYLHLDI